MILIKRLSCILSCAVLSSCSINQVKETCLIQLKANRVICIDHRVEILPTVCSWYKIDSKSYSCPIEYIDGYEANKI
jgi:hypothetical protein